MHIINRNIQPNATTNNNVEQAKAIIQTAMSTQHSLSVEELIENHPDLQECTEGEIHQAALDLGFDVSL